MAVPIACAVVVGLSFINVWIAPVGFVTIPLIARLLDPGKDKTKARSASEGEEAASS
jgi:hypothetical protein